MAKAADELMHDHDWNALGLTSQRGSPYPPTYHQFRQHRVEQQIRDVDFLLLARNPIQAHKSQAPEVPRSWGGALVLLIHRQSIDLLYIRFWSPISGRGKQGKDAKVAIVSTFRRPN